MGGGRELAGEGGVGLDGWEMSCRYAVLGASRESLLGSASQVLGAWLGVRWMASERGLWMWMMGGWRM